jgi:ribonuclease J
LKIIIHKVNHEIGGTCIQVSTGSTTILLDVGLPLSPASRQAQVPSIRVDAVLVSHPYRDHFGLLDRLSLDTPVYMGELGRELIDLTRVLLGTQRHRNCLQFFQPWEPLIIGDIRITPYLVDHSAVDAYAFLVEAGGKRVFYSGDFRSHGRKGKLFDALVNHPLPNIDLLFLEGTMLQRSNDPFPTEAAVEKAMHRVINKQKNISFIISSLQNIDRIVSVFRACKKAGKILVIDIYTAFILEQVRKLSENVPGMEWEEIRVYAEYSQDEKLKANPGYFGDFRGRLHQHRVKWQEMTANPARYVYYAKMSSFRKINAFREGEGPVNVIYSQWQGYLDGSHHHYFGAEQIAELRDCPEINFVYAHTSGHAPLKDLQSFASALKPKTLIPIHTEHGDMFENHFDNVVTLTDGIPFELD